MTATPRSTEAVSAPIADHSDLLISSQEARRIAGCVSSMTLWRWVKAGVIPKPMQIRGRNYWRRSEFMRALELAAEDQAPAAD